MNKFVKLGPNLIIFIIILVINLNINAQEILYLHTDKSDYISGETIQFKSYLLKNNTQQLSNSSTVIYFQLTGYNKIEFSDLRANIENGIGKGQFYISDSLKTGYYYLSAYTNCMRNYPIETYFNKKIFITNQNDDKLDSIIDYSIIENHNLQNFLVTSSFNNSTACKITTDKYSYKPGEKIKLNIKLDSIIHVTGITSLSVSVNEQSPFEDTIYTSNIINHLTSVNNEWKKLLDNNYCSSGKYIAEKKAYIFKGQVLSKTNQSPLTNVTVLLSTPDSISNLQYYTTGQDGVFYFQLNKYYDNKLLFLQLNDSIAVYKNYIFKIDDKKIDTPKFFKSILNMNISERIYLENSQKLALVSKIYNPINQQKDSETIVKIKEPRFPFFGIPDETIKPSEYEELSDFNEMTQNYIRLVKLKKNTDGFKLNMLDFENKLMQEKNALLLVNSIPVFSYDVLEALKANTIQKIEMKYRHIIYGILNFYGVLSIWIDQKLASNIYSNIEIPCFKNKVMTYSGEFFSRTNKSQEIQSNKLPDFRQVLYWNPELILDEKNESNIEFNASEFKTKYNIEVQGITADNKMVFSRRTIEVK
jgi:hypothetical protein